MNIELCFCVLLRYRMLIDTIHLLWPYTEHDHMHASDEERERKKTHHIFFTFYLLAFASFNAYLSSRKYFYNNQLSVCAPRASVCVIVVNGVNALENG